MQGGRRKKAGRPSPCKHTRPGHSPMKSLPRRPAISRRSFLMAAAGLPLLSLPYIRTGQAQTVDPLPSWNNGMAKETIVGFVQATVDKAMRTYVPPEQRIATFDQDGTLWVEQPMYTQVLYCLDRVPAVVKQRPQLRERQPFKTVLSGDREAIARLPLHEIEEIMLATLTGMTVEQFTAEEKEWLQTARHTRGNRPYTELN